MTVFYPNLIAAFTKIEKGGTLIKNHSGSNEIWPGVV